MESPCKDCPHKWAIKFADHGPYRGKGCAEKCEKIKAFQDMDRDVVIVSGRIRQCFTRHASIS